MKLFRNFTSKTLNHFQLETFDFKSYHIRAMNAQTEEEKANINQELKNKYASLSEEQKREFNIQLETFLIKEYANIQSVVDGVQQGNSLN